jgi:N-methylhydantoinase A
VTESRGAVPGGRASWVVGIDIGGTFTDAIATSTDGEVRVAKVPSTPADLGLAFEQALNELAKAGVRPQSIMMIFHGTTVATNALLTGRTAKVALATTQGFRDILGYRNGSRPVVYDLMQARPPQLVRRRDRIEVIERISGLGEVVTPLTSAEIERVVAALAAAQPEAVAVCLLFSYLDDSHERMLGEAIAKHLPDVPVTVSAEVAREFREYPRTSTTVINAALRPLVGNYLLGLRARIGSLAIAPPVQIMQSNGGCLPADRAAQQAHRLVLSGPAAGVAGTVALGTRYGISQLISLDMGGTSLDVCLVPDGIPPVTARQEIGGNPILAPAVDIVTVGAGGGSIVRIDRAGRLRVGPDSAGAVPGPAAYGTGGDQATLTDAHVVAGTLPESLPLAGKLRLDAIAAGAALEPVAAGLGLSLRDAADGIIRLAVAQITAALRQVSVQRGIDPREYTLVAFGGAGPLHAGMLLREMRFRSVLVPQFPGVFAASGLTSTDIRVDDSRTVLRVLRPELIADLAAWYAAAGRALTTRLRRDGVAAAGIRLSASADCRFLGQGYELNVPLQAPGQRGVAALAGQFMELHLRTYGHANPQQEVEVVNLRLSAFGALPAHTAASGTAPGQPTSALGREVTRAAASALAGHADARLPGTSTARRLPVYRRDLIEAGQAARGPAIVHQLDSTTIVLPGQRARVDELGSMWLEESR